jgi:hypothetical protein
VNAARASVYADLMCTLRVLGPEKLLEDERSRVRAAADALVLGTEAAGDPDVVQALNDLLALGDRLRTGGRWSEAHVQCFIGDVLACGSGEATERSSAGGNVARPQPVCR